MLLKVAASSVGRMLVSRPYHGIGEFLFIFISLEFIIPFRPLDEEGKPFSATMLDYAYMHYEFILPCCPCSIAGIKADNCLYAMKIWVVSNIESRYFHKVVLGCQFHYDGCGIFSR